MLLITICLCCLLGVSLFAAVGRRRPLQSVRSAYATAPADWPDIPVAALGLFRRDGRINHPVVRSTPPPVPRLRSFNEAQAFVLDRIGIPDGPMPRIVLRLSEYDGPTWTEIVIGDAAIAQLPTAALTGRGDVRDQSFR